MSSFTRPAHSNAHPEHIVFCHILHSKAPTGSTSPLRTWRMMLGALSCWFQRERTQISHTCASLCRPFGRCSRGRQSQGMPHQQQQWQTIMMMPHPKQPRQAAAEHATSCAAATCTGGSCSGIGEQQAGQLLQRHSDVGVTPASSGVAGGNGHCSTNNSTNVRLLLLHIM